MDKYKKKQFYHASCSMNLSKSPWLTQKGGKVCINIVKKAFCNVSWVSCIVFLLTLAILLSGGLNIF